MECRYESVAVPGHVAKDLCLGQEVMDLVMVLVGGGLIGPRN